MENGADNGHKGHRERLRQSYLKAGALDSFHEHQILEMLLFYSIPRKDVNPLAHKLIDSFGSLYGVLNAGYNELIKFGLSENTAVLIKLTSDIYRTAECNMLKSKTILSTKDAMEFCYGLMSGLHNEKICVICLNLASKLLHYEMISIGDPTKTYFSPRSIVEIAVSHGAAAIVLAHNHPSGNCRPSQADIESTVSLERILKQIGIRLQEHIIVAFPHCHAMMRGITMNMLNSEAITGSPEKFAQAVVMKKGSSVNAFKDSETEEIPQDSICGENGGTCSDSTETETGKTEKNEKTEEAKESEEAKENEENAQNERTGKNQSSADKI